MKIRWLGHACFLLETEKFKIITDPFNKEVGYPVINVTADVVTISHDHWDHNAAQLVGGSPMIIDQEGSFTYQEIQIKGIGSYHDDVQGKKRGTNIMYKISTEGMTLLHLGDLGHLLSDQQVREIGEIDILFLPVGGNYTIDAREAYKITELIKPRIIIPMHFKTPAISFDIDPVEAFTGYFEKVIKKPFLQIDELSPDYSTQVIVLDYPVN
jgi:L-ascorbate metabolism protein UlaG (beta-lactamase superfamily)